jgi:dTDP-4-dehydrorhamnose reductase
MNAILLLGGDGQVGRELRARALDVGVPIRSMSHQDVDITDAAKIRGIIAATAPSLVVNAAGYTNVDRAESEAEAAFRANASGPQIIARACAAANLPIVHLSTDYVFDGTVSDPYRETDPIAPISTYGLSKAAGEAAVRSTIREHVILRTSWVYGVYGSNFLKTMLRLGAERDELKIVADQFGSPTGSADLAEAILTVAARVRDGAGPWGTYHFCGTGVTTWHGFASEIFDTQVRFTGRRPKLLAIGSADYPCAAKRPVNSALDCSKFAMTFGFRAADWRQRTRSVVASLSSGKVLADVSVGSQ